MNFHFILKRFTWKLVDDPTEIPNGLPDENSGPIDTFDFSGQLSVGSHSIVNATSTNTPTLVANTMYWFSLYTTGSPTFALWATNEETISPLADRMAAGFPLFSEWQIIPGNENPPTTPAFQINAVPEPSTYALIIGGACLGLVIWKRRRSVKES